MAAWVAANASALNQLAQLTPEPIQKSFFTNGGGESVESALKMARQYTGRYETIVLKNAFHGLSFGALAATGAVKYKKGFGPFAAYLDPSGVWSKPVNLSDHGFSTTAGIATYSPDGKYIAFVSDRSDTSADIYIMKADGSDVFQITHDGTTVINYLSDWVEGTIGL